jgi:hypothetical protein
MVLALDRRALVRLDGDEKGTGSIRTPGGVPGARAERRCGELLARTEKHGGGRPTANPSNDARGSTPTLREMGLTYDESSRYQQLAAKSTARSATVFIVSEDTRHGQVSELCTGPSSLPIPTGPEAQCHLHVGADRSHLLRPENFTF